MSNSIKVSTVLAGFTLEELQEEIELRRQPALPIPFDLEEIKWKHVLDCAETLMVDVKNGHSLSEDFEDDMFRTVMEVIYGSDVWLWRNSKMKAR